MLRLTLAAAALSAALALPALPISIQGQDAAPFFSQQWLIVTIHQSTAVLQAIAG
jgi:hypothetical protein